MPSAGTLRVKGLREFGQAIKKAERATRLEVRDALREVAEPVRKDAQRLFNRYDSGSASGFRVRVWGRGYGVFVEQNKRKVTGRRPDYGSLQMKKALLPSLEKNEKRIEQEMEKALDKIEDILE